MKKYEIYEKNTNNLLFTGVGDSGLTIIDYYESLIKEDLEGSRKQAIIRSKRQVGINRQVRKGKKIFKAIEKDFKNLNQDSFLDNIPLLNKLTVKFTLEEYVKIARDRLNNEDKSLLEMYCHDEDIIIQYHYSLYWPKRRDNYKRLSSNKYYLDNDKARLSMQKVFLEVV